MCMLVLVGIVKLHLQLLLCIVGEVALATTAFNTSIHVSTILCSAS